MNPCSSVNISSTCACNLLTMGMSWYVCKNVDRHKFKWLDTKISPTSLPKWAKHFLPCWSHVCNPSLGITSTLAFAKLCSSCTDELVFDVNPWDSSIDNKNLMGFHWVFHGDVIAMESGCNTAAMGVSKFGFSHGNSWNFMG